MFKLGLSKVFFFAILLFTSNHSFSQTPDAEVVKQETIIVIDKNKLTKTLYFEIRINNRGGEKFSKISIPHSTLSKASNIKAHIRDSNNRIIKELKKSEIIQRSSISDMSLYEDDFIKEFTLKHNSYPYTIEYSYQVSQTEFLHIDFWSPVFYENTPTLHAKLKLILPLNYKIAISSHHINEPEIDTIENKVHYLWLADNKSTFSREPFSPQLRSLLPNVTIIPIDFSFSAKGSQKNWESFVFWQAQLLKGANDLPESEKSKVLSLIEGEKDDKEKIRALYHYLQDATRYVNVTIETGGLKPYPASYVTKNKFGDCKALSNYFRSVLDVAGIKSYYSKVNAGNPILQIRKDFPSQQFNHIILYIPLKDEDIWLDCTSDGAFNYLGTFTQNRDVLIIDTENPRFIKTPALKPDDVIEQRRINIKYSLKNANVLFRNTYKGRMYEQLFDLQLRFNETGKARIFRNYILPEGFDLLDYQIINHDRDDLEINLNYNTTSQLLYKHYGNDIIISNIPFDLYKLNSPKSRKLPVQIDYPIYKVDSLTYEIPSGYKLESSLGNHSISTKFGEYSYKAQINGNLITVEKSFLMHSGNYQLEEYEKFFEFYDKVYNLEYRNNISLRKLN